MVNPSPEMQLATSLRTNIARLARAQRSNSHRNTEALPFSLLSALSTLERLGPISPTELAIQEGVRKPSMTRALVSLEERGLVARIDHPSDGRQAILEITPAGKAELKRSRRIIDSWYATRLKKLTAKERDALRAAASALERLADELA